MAEEKRFALLIDADNVSPKYLNVMLSEAKAYGTVSIRRAYGDWTDNQKKTWKKMLLENSIIPIQQFSYTIGKNSSDSSMIIDAMDILYTDDVGGFILATSDSDFTRLAMRLREAGKMVVGMGESKTPASFVQSCEVFKALDVLAQNMDPDEEQDSGQGEDNSSGEGEAPAETSSITKLSRIKKAIFSIIDKNSDEEGKMLLSELGRLLSKRYPDFDERNYGRYRKFSDFIRDIDGLDIEMVNHSDRHKTPLAYVMRTEAAEKMTSKEKKPNHKSK